MAVLVDDARWLWRGSRWAHLVSDSSAAELHDFAARLGKRRVGFQGDHYDVDALDRGRALAIGAEPVSSRELLRRLRGAGLRDRRAKPAWELLARWPIGTEVGELPEPLTPAADLAASSRGCDVRVLGDRTQLVLLVDVPPSTPVLDPPAAAWRTGPRPDGWYSIELFVAR
ncbi:MAG: DUF4031 domain-containing protein [Acidimicrobiales bacterium]